ncbi:MAG TPA: hypothetical protein DEP84_32070, partial [Chloroflexi bacterium]|nr:hypothetical protein [Chloroflexota bacterium]
SVAGQLPEPLALVLLAAARGAFVQGLHLVAAISAAIAIAAAIVGVLVLRRVPAGSQADGQPDLDAATATIIALDQQEDRYAA